MNFSEQLRILQPARENPALLALAMVDFAHHALPSKERARIKDALVATAMPHWCDSTFLAAMLKSTPEEATSLLGHLRALTVIEPFPARGTQAVNVHEAFRLAMRNHLRSTDTARWTAISTHAYDYINTDTTAHAQIEAVYHLFAINQHAAGETSRKLDGEFKSGGHLEARHALALALAELIASGWLTKDVEVQTLPFLLPLVVCSEPEELGMRTTDTINQIRALSQREMMILKWMVTGKTDWEIAQIFGVTLRTVRFHVETIRHKLGVMTRTETVTAMLNQEPSRDASKKTSDHSSPSLSKQEVTILNWIKAGKTEWEISQIIEVSEQAVRNQIESIFSKLYATGRAEAIKAYATRIRQEITA